MSKRSQRLAAFLLRLLLLYFGLAVLWPAFDRSYGRLYAAAAGSLFSSFGREGSVHFARTEAPDGLDLEIVLRNRRTGGASVSRRSTRYTGYAMTTLSMSLILATPLPRRRRLMALLWAFLAVHVVIAASLGLSLVDSFSNGDQIAVFHFTPFSKTLLRIAVHHSSELPTFPFLMPFLIWAITTFQCGDLNALGLEQADAVGRAPAGARQKGRANRLKS